MPQTGVFRQLSMHLPVYARVADAFTKWHIEANVSPSMLHTGLSPARQFDVVLTNEMK